MQVAHGTTRHLQPLLQPNHQEQSWPSRYEPVASRKHTQFNPNPDEHVHLPSTKTIHNSTLLDHTTQQSDRCIINTEMHPPQNIYIKGVLSDSSSVLMAEVQLSSLGFNCWTQTYYNQELVCFFNSTDHSNPLDWRIKHLTRHFIICLQRQNHYLLTTTKSQDLQDREASKSDGSYSSKTGFPRHSVSSC